MAGFINIGFGNIVNRDKIVAVVSPDAAPVKRMVQQGKEEKIVLLFLNKKFIYTYNVISEVII
mgnify:CR=1 FL=1